MVRKRKRDRDEADEFLEEMPRPRSRFRRTGTWLWATLFFAVLIAAAPTFLVNSPLVDWAVQKATSGAPIKVELGAVSLGWISPLTVQGVKVSDMRGKPLFQADNVRVAKALWGLITDSSDLREVVLEKPRIQLELRPDGSNVEDILRALPPELREAWFSSKGDASGPIPNIRITEGEILVANGTSQEVWRIGDVSLITLPGESPALKRFEAKGMVQSPREQGAAKWSAAADIGPQKNLLTADIKAAELPVDLVECALQRFVESPILAGHIATDCKVRFAPDNPANLLVEGQSDLKGFAFTCAALKGEAVQIREARLPIKAELRDGVALVERLEFQAPWAQAKLQGRLPTAIGQQGDPIAQLLQNDFRVDGAVDLAQLVKMIPTAIALREDTQIDQAAVDLWLECGPDAEGRSLKGELRTGKIAALRAGQSITWDRPIAASLDAVVQGGAWRVRAMEASSEFLRVSGSGDVANFTADASADLNQLTQELSRFVDVAHLQMRGQAQGRLTWQSQPPAVANANGPLPSGLPLPSGHPLATGQTLPSGQASPTPFSLLLETQLRDLAIALPDRRQWVESSLQAKLEARGSMTGMTPAVIDAAQFAAESPTASGTAELLQPVALLGKEPARAQFRLQASGDVRQWQARAAALGVQLPYELGGQCNIQMEGAAGASAGQLSKLLVTIDNLQVARPEYAWREKRMEIAGEASWDASRGIALVPRLSIASGAVSLVASDVSWEQPEKSLPTVVGNVRYTADLAQVGGLVFDPRYVRASGRSQGSWKFASRGVENTADLSGALEKLLLTRTRSGPQGVQDLEVVWREERANVNAKLRWNAAAGELWVDSVNVQSGILKLAANGKVSDFSNRAMADLQGTMRYDLATITKLLEPRFGDSVKLTGDEDHAFQIVGPLKPASSALANQSDPYAWLSELQAKANFGWSSADVLGIQVGRADIRSQLAQGLFELERTEVPVNEGRMFLGAGLRLSPGPSKLTLPAGPVVSNVSITPQTCSRGLKFIAPILADATEAQGSFSLSVNDGNYFPLSDPRQGVLEGKLDIHGANVKPGPLAREVIAIAKQFEAVVKTLDPQALTQAGEIVLVRVDEQTTQYRLEGKRVYHDQFSFAFGDVRMKTEGSVGLDESLALEVECRLPSQLGARYPRIKPLIDQPLRVALAGDLRRPIVNVNALDAYYRQFIRQAAADTLRGELGRQLDRLFTPKQ